MERRAGGAPRWSRVVAGWTLVLLGLLAGVARGGGGPENILLIIDPSNRDSQYVGNYYKAMRRIPDSNVIFMEPRAGSFAAHTDFQLPAVLGALEERGIGDHIDYIVVTPGSSFFVAAPGLVSDGCATVSRFSTSSVYTLAFITEDVLGGLPSSTLNHYYSNSTAPWAFDSETRWNLGVPSPGEFGAYYFIGAMLGYSGERGNTVEETIAMIDRSVAADGTRPAGTFYYMRTTDQNRSGPRHNHFPAAVAAIQGLGGDAEQIEDVLPLGHQDCLGVMTGWASPDIEGGDFTLLPGSIADHLTSFAATFDTAAQTKLSRWIVKGASGSAGTVQEPCNYAGKFPHARAHVYYFQGLSLGESLLRSLQYVPFQVLLYGDPLTRPFAYLPTVEVPDFPGGVVSGDLAFTPMATTDHPNAGIGELEIHVDGVRRAAGPPGTVFTLDTADWPDGPHDVRVIAFEDSIVRSQGSWLGVIRTDNHGRSVAFDATPTLGDLSTSIEVTVIATGGSVAEVQLRLHGRILAASPGDSATWTLLGDDLGAGPVEVSAFAIYTDGKTARSEQVSLEITSTAAPPGDPGPAAPIAYGYSRSLESEAPVLLELPALDLDGSDLTWTLLDLPAQGSVAGQGPVVLFRPDVGACGEDVLTFRVSDGAADSDLATITISYLRQPFVRGEINEDGSVDIGDAIFLLGYLFQGAPPPTEPQSADVNADGNVDVADVVRLLDYLFSQGDPPPFPFPDPACP